MPTSPISAEPSVPQRIVIAVAGGEAQSRTELAAALDLAPSTVSLHVQALLDAGVLTEQGEGPSRGGRRPRMLEVAETGGHILAADIGGSRARLAVADLAGRIAATGECEVSLAEGPEPTLSAVAAAIDALLATVSPTPVVRGIAVALPGPVDVDAGRVQLPSRMPGWNGFPVADWFADRLGAVALVDNDANMMALGEHLARRPAIRHSITVKAGGGIGSGIIIASRLYRGATGDAGDITHAAVAAANGLPCSCGNTGCLETIASGAALVQQLRDGGTAVSSIDEVVALAMDADVSATRLVREAGRHLGEVLCTVVNFFNPEAVFLGGVLSQVDPFVAAVRSQLYQGCHPLVTSELTIDRCGLGMDAGLYGCIRLIGDHVLTAPSFLA